MPRSLDAFLAILLLAALVTLAAKLTRAPDALNGAARVIDGDTIELGGQRLRLLGMDAPELDQLCQQAGRPYRCGEVARDSLRALARPGVNCAVSGRDRYGRGLAVCQAGGQDLGRALVVAGLAVAYGRYEAEERMAASRRVGLWAGEFERPSEWRKAHPH